METAVTELPPLVVVTAGGLARETAVAALTAGRVVRGFLDDDGSMAGTEPVAGVPVLGRLDSVTSHADAQVVVCAGKGSSRASIVDRLGGLGVEPQSYAAVVHPSVTVPADCVVGPGSVLLAGVVLTTAVTIGAHVVCMPGVVLTHDCVAEDYATLCAGVVLGGTVRIGSSAYVGMAASVRENLTLGAGSVVGMGSVVLEDVPPGQVWAGVPARQLRQES